MKTHGRLLTASFLMIVALLAWSVVPTHAQGRGGGSHGGGGGWHGGGSSHGGGWHGGSSHGGGWHGGSGWHGGWHGGWRGGVFIGWPFWYPYGYGYYPYPYDYGYPIYSPPVVQESSPPVYIEPEPPPQQYWYYCQSAQGYYPYVKECPEGWQQVLPQPPAQAPR